MEFPSKLSMYFSKILKDYITINNRLFEQDTAIRMEFLKTHFIGVMNYNYAEYDAGHEK
jgi:hypothetical protein